MEQNKLSQYPQPGIGDKAIGGLFTGFFAGVVMIVSIYMLTIIFRMDTRSVLINLAPRETNTLFFAVASHLALFSVYGIVYRLVRTLFLRKINAQIKGWLLGITFSAFLVIVNRLLFFPGLLFIPGDPFPVIFVVSHLVYGIFIGNINNTELAG